MKKQVKQLIIMIVIIAAIFGAYVYIRSVNNDEKERNDAEQEAAVIHAVQLETDSITAFSYKYEGELLSLIKNDGSWINEADSSMDIDESTIETMLGNLNDLIADRQIKDVKDISEFGFNEPVNEINITAGNTNVKLTFGMHNELVKGYYMMIGETDDNIYLVPETFYNVFNKSVEDLIVKEETAEEENITQ